MWGGTAAAVLLAFSVAPGIARTPLAVQTRDGVSIQAIEYRADAKKHRRTIVIIGDGVEGAGSATVDELAETLFFSGLDVVTWDRRGTGHSDGLWDFGQSDADDALAVLAVIDSRTFDHDVGLIGIGTGGVAALTVANKTAKVKAIAVYGVGANGVPSTAPGAWSQFKRPQSFTGRWLLRLRGVRIALGPVSANATEFPLASLAGKLGRRPLLVSTGGRDERVLVPEVKELFRAANAPKEWVFAPNADDMPPIEEWAPKLEDFFRRRLK